MRVTGVSTARSGKQSPAAAPEFAVAANGSPIFLAAGRWSVVRVDNAEQSVRTVDAQLGIPLVQRDGGPYRWADPQDLLHDASARSDYALLMAHDTQRFLMQRPKIEFASLNISSVLPPKVADPYTMLTSQGLFPRVDRAINLPVGTELVASALKLAGDRLDLPAGTLGLIDTKLVNLSAWSDTANFAKAALYIDSLDDWKIRLKEVRQSLEYDGLGEIMTLVHDFESAPEQPASSLTPTWSLAPKSAGSCRYAPDTEELAPALPGRHRAVQARRASSPGTTFRF